MDKRQRRLYRPTTVVHPGEIVVEYLEVHGWLQSDLARRAGLAPKTISEICNGKSPITPATALALEKVFQRPAHFWLNLQRQHDEAEARQRDEARTIHWKEWAGKFPLKEMVKKGYSVRLGQSNVDTLLGYFGVSSPESWDAVWRASSVAYRQTRKFETSEEAVSAWVRETERLAQEQELADFDENVLLSKIEDLRHLTRIRADTIMAPCQKVCAEAGVAVVWVPELSRTGISGCARWLTDRKALIGLTLRYKTDDQMWFTFFHELGHLLLHRKKRSFVLDNAADSFSDNIVDPEMQQYESEASIFAADTLIPPHLLAEFIKKQEFTNESIHSFSEELGIGPGLVVGRLQFEGILKRHVGNSLKQTLHWNFLDNEQSPKEAI